jgi:hypothetical protein
LQLRNLNSHGFFDAFVITFATSNALARECNCIAVAIALASWARDAGWRTIASGDEAIQFIWLAVGPAVGDVGGAIVGSFEKLSIYWLYNTSA